MEKNYRIEYAENELNKAQAIENYVRKGIAKDLDGVIDDLNDYDCNGNEATPTKACIERLEKLLDVLKSVERTSEYRRKDLEQTVARDKADEVTE